MKNRKRIFKNITIIVSIIVFIIIPFSISYFVYEDNFGDRYETYAPLSRNINEFDGLKSEKYTFTSDDGQELVGYKYFKDNTKVKGVVIISHGLGGGGHNSYMDVADYLSSNGYLVFAYDATGNDESEGSSVKGLPQGLIDLEYAINFVKETDDFKDLPIMLFGHSWGGYSVGSVLNINHNIEAIVSVAGFNKAIDIITEEGKKMIGNGINLLEPYISAYERFKFGKYASYNCMEGFENSTAGIMIIHSEDDTMIPIEGSFDIYYNKYKDNPRFKFVKFENRGHNYAYYADEASQYNNEFNNKFNEYKESLNAELTPEIKAKYINDNMDKKLLYDLDEELMDSIVEFYDSYLND